jgi:hypothetical protein
MNDLILLVAHAEITRRVTDAEQRRRARSCRTGAPRTATPANRLVQL